MMWTHFLDQLILFDIDQLQYTYVRLNYSNRTGTYLSFIELNFYESKDINVLLHTMSLCNHVHVWHECWWLTIPISLQRF